MRTISVGLASDWFAVIREANMRSTLPAKARLHGLDVRKPIAPDFSRPTFCIHGLLCDFVTLEEAKQSVLTCIRESGRCNLVTPNASFLRLSRSDPEFRDAALASDLSLIDGMPLVWLARMLGVAVPDRVCGSDLCATLMAQPGERLNAFFFGATAEIGQRVRERLDERTCSLRCAGVLSPGFGSVESMSDPRTLETINRANPDLLIVSIGARKGVVWLHKNEHLLTPPVVCNLGATIHFIAGTVTRAPVFFRRHGLEWLWRIKEEPMLCTRYARDLTTLISVLLGQILPYLLQRAFFRPSAAQLTEARLQHYRRGAADILELVGDWTKDNLAPVRAALTEATRRPSDLIIDLDGVTFVDAAFLGQILVAYGYQRRIHRAFLLHASGGRVRSLLRLHGCSYLVSANESPAESQSPALRGRETHHQSLRKLWERTIASRTTPGTRSHGH
jgi:N-acetylglucosaminyldiphosphoundecaprenol N-acetyl-beta-D-mannosaminyltransferase